MEEFYDKKEVGNLGISNCYDLDTLKFLYANSKVKPSFVQNRFYAQSGYDRELREFCKKNEIIYQSFWSLTANPHIINSDILKKISLKYNRSAELIFYRFLNHINIIPSNGTTSVNHMIEDLKIDDFELLEEEIKDISSLLL